MFYPARVSPNIISVRPYTELPAQFEHYLLNPSNPLQKAELWAQAEGCDTHTASCRQQILEATRAAGYVLEQMIGFEAV